MWFLHKWNLVQNGLATPAANNNSGGFIIEMVEIYYANHKQDQICWISKTRARERIDFIQTCYFSIIFRISGIVNLQQWIFFSLLVGLLIHLFPVHSSSTSWKHLCFQGVDNGCIGNEWVKIPREKWSNFPFFGIKRAQWNVWNFCVELVQNREH